MHAMNNISLALPMAALIAMTAPALAGSPQTLWATNPEIPTFFNSGTTGQSVKTPISNKEVADDFNAIGTIEKVLADGNDCQGCFSNQPVTGVYVRFYEWTSSGPGALQSEQFLAADDPNFVWTPGYGPEYLQITLPQPFQANGWHFVSVQVEFSTQSSSTGKWYFYPVNWGATMGVTAYARDNNAGGAWAPLDAARDASFALLGTSGGVPSMGILTASSEPITPSARLRITGDGFGDEQGDGAVSIDGQPAILTHWSNSVIVAYVPEATAIGAVELMVQNDAGESDVLTIDVQPRQPSGPVQWRFAVDADIIINRPGVGPDGSIYINDYNFARLYKLSADGGLVWIADALRGQIGLGAEGPVIVGDDGTVYLGVNPLGPTVEIVAFNPDGSVKWVFTNPVALSVLTGPAIGPDGNVYATFSTTGPGQMGVVSLSPQGDLRWFGSGEPFIHNDASIGGEVAFSSSTLGGEIDQIAVATSGDGGAWVYGLSMDDGDTNWSHPIAWGGNYLTQLQVEVATGLDGTVYITEGNVTSTGWGLRARHPSNGQPLWVYDPGMLGEVSAPVVGSDGTIYIGWGLAFLAAVNPDGEEIWQYHGGPGGFRRMPAISPNNEVLVFAGGPFGTSGYVKALDATTGDPLLHVDLETAAGDIFAVDRPTFTADSSTAYVPTNIVNNPGNPHAYVYAITIGEPTVVGDVTGDGLVNVADLLAVINAWGNCPAPPAACAADVTGDGLVNVSDLLMVINNWS